MMKANSLKLTFALLIALSIVGCATESKLRLKIYRENIQRQCEEDAELLEMSVQECFDRLNIW